MKLSEKQRIFTRNIARLIEYAYDTGIELTFGEAYRTIDQQWLYYNGYEIRGRELVKAKKRSWTMQSKHLDRLAVDFNFFIDGELTYDKDILYQLGEYWESLNENNEWGGFWTQTDTPHFQMS